MSVVPAAKHSSRTRKGRSWPQQNPPPLYAVVRDPRVGPPKPPRHTESCQLRKPSICAGSSPDLRKQPRCATGHSVPPTRRANVGQNAAAKRASRSLDAFNFESASECSTSEYFTPPTSAGSIWELWHSDSPQYHALVGTNHSAKLFVPLPASAPPSPCDWKRRSPEFSGAGTGPRSFGSLNFVKPRRGGLWSLLSKLPVSQRHKRAKFPPRYDLDIGPPTLISHTRGQRIDWVRYFSETSLAEVSGGVRRPPNDFDLRHQPDNTPLSQENQTFQQGYRHYRCFHEQPDIPPKDQWCPDVPSEAVLCLHSPLGSPHRCPIQDRRSEALGGSRPQELESGPPEKTQELPKPEADPCSPVNSVFYVDFKKPLEISEM